MANLTKRRYEKARRKVEAAYAKGNTKRAEKYLVLKWKYWHKLYKQHRKWDYFLNA